MFATIFYLLSICLILFLIKENVKLSSIVRHDKTMFMMAQLRREVMAYLRKKHVSVSVRDVEQALAIENQCSFVISNHKMLYTRWLSWENIKKSLSLSKHEIEDTESMLSQVHNKTVKGFYIKFGLILLENIKDHTYFFNIKFVYSILKSFSFLFFKDKTDKIRAYIKWFNSADREYSAYQDRYGISPI